jgi:hypothetical protein
MSAGLQGQEDQNDREPLQVQLHQSMNNQLDEQLEESLLIKVKGKNNIIKHNIVFYGCYKYKTYNNFALCTQRQILFLEKLVFRTW